MLPYLILHTRAKIHHISYPAKHTIDSLHFFMVKIC